MFEVSLELRSISVTKNVDSSFCLRVNEGNDGLI